MTIAITVQLPIIMHEPYGNTKAIATRRSLQNNREVAKLKGPHDGDFHSPLCELKRVTSNYVPGLLVHVEQVAIF